MLSFEELKKLKKPRTHTVQIYFEDEPVERLNRLQREKARLNLQGDKAPKAQHRQLDVEIEQAKADVRETSAEVTLQSIGRLRWEELVDSCPPEEEDHLEARRQMNKSEKDTTIRADFHFADFAPKLIAASAVEPKMTEKQVRELMDEWNGPEFVELFEAAMVVNTTRRAADWGKG